METHNIISTPDITGNIGSCTSQKIEVTTGYNLLTYNYNTVVTNSCTGVVTEYPAWGLSFLPISAIIIALVIFFSILFAKVLDDWD